MSSIYISIDNGVNNVFFYDGTYCNVSNAGGAWNSIGVTSFPPVDCLINFFKSNSIILSKCNNGISCEVVKAIQSFLISFAYFLIMIYGVIFVVKIVRAVVR